MEVFSYLFRNGVLKEETPISYCGIKGHSKCLNVTKKYPCGCVEYFKQHFVYACRHCGSNAKSIVIQKSKTYCPNHKRPYNDSDKESHKAHISEAMRRFHAR